MTTMCSEKTNGFPFPCELYLGGTPSETARSALSFLKPGDSCALSLGSTFKELLPYWVLPLHNKGVRFFPADERLVPLNHPDSNWGVLQSLFFNPLGDELAMTHCAVSLRQYRTLLRDIFGEPCPKFNVVFLGLGADGHTAALFPDTEYPDFPAVLETESPNHPHRRLTLSPGVLKAADELVLVISGVDKEVAWKRLQEGDGSLPLTPILKNRKMSRIILDKRLG